MRFPDRATKTSHHQRLSAYQERMAYLFIAPVIILFLTFTVYPAIRALYLSFTSYDILTPARWIGLDNYRRLLGDDMFGVTLKNVIAYTLMYVPLMVMFSLCSAMALNHTMRGTKIFRTVFYLPGLTSTIAASTVWLWLLNPEYGLVNQILGYFGISGPAWLANSSTALFSIVLVTVWQNMGGNMVIYLAGLQGIPEYLNESARIDGASRWQIFRYVTWPFLGPTTFFVSTMSLIGAFQLFDQAFVMTQGGPGNSTRTPVYLIYNNGFNELKMGYASTQAFILFLMILTVSLFNIRINRENVM